ncbi:MAG TPA: hypothetical protein VE713_19020 [Pyrinomonadaceae bacterium]|jgi:peptidoglycan hydrolase CwlO-like protein|nr:hypothetical protein [Pyrinomonadaceae bacterium]
MLRSTLCAVVLTGVVVSAGCSWWRAQSIRSQLKDLGTQKEASQQKLDGLNQKVTSLRDQSNKLANDLRANRNKTMALIRDNPGIVACIASGAVAMSEGNAFSDDIKQMGGAIGLGCLGLYLFSQDFQKSVDNFKEQLDRASELEKSLQSQMDSLKPKLDAETRSWQIEKKSFDELSEKIAALESEMEKLK